MTELSGYVEIMLGGKNRPLKFNNLSIRKLCEKYKMTLGQCEELLKTDIQDWPMDKFYDLFYFALVVGCRHAGVERDFDEDDVTEWFGELTPEDMTSMVEALAKSMQLTKPLQAPGKKK